MPPELRPFTGPEHQPFAVGPGPDAALLIHGFPGTPAELHALGTGLSMRGWHARGLLLPGFGPDIPTIDQYTRADWLAACEQAWQTLAKEGHAPRLLIGYSMGAALALNLAERLHPTHLVLIAPFWRLRGFLPRLAPLAKWFAPQLRPFKNADFSDPNIRKGIARFLPHVDFNDPEVQTYLREKLTLPLNAIDEILRLGREGYRQASRLDIPTLIIQGAQDKMVRPEDTQKLAGRLRGQVAYREISANHDLMHHPHVVAEALRMIQEFTQL